jgi:hypothetical protein
MPGVCRAGCDHVGNDVRVNRPGEDQPSEVAPGAWAAPESAGGSLFSAAEFLPAGGDGEPSLARELTGDTSVAAAGVAVVRGDAPWPESDEGTDLGDGNPLTGVEPVGPGGVLDGGFDLLRVGFGRLVGLAAGLLLPLQLIELAVAARSGIAEQVSIEQGSFAGMAILGGASTSSSFGLVFAAVRVVVLSFLGMTVGVMVAELLRGRLLSGRQLASRAARRWWVAALIPLLTIPVKSVGFCLVYVGWFLLDSLLMCASVVAGAEGAGPLRSFGRSWKLARTSYGVALSVSIGGFVLMLVQQVASLVLLVTQPLTACIAGRLYVELRCRGEALDLERRRVAQGLGGDDLLTGGGAPSVAVPSAGGPR